MGGQRIVAWRRRLSAVDELSEALQRALFRAVMVPFAFLVSRSPGPPVRAMLPMTVLTNLTARVLDRAREAMESSTTRCVPMKFLRGPARFMLNRYNFDRASCCSLELDQ